MSMAVENLQAGHQIAPLRYALRFSTAAAIIELAAR